MVLVNIQMGLFLSFERMVTTMIDHAPADLWIVPFGTKCFEDPSLLDTHDQALALASRVAQAVPVAIDLPMDGARWRDNAGVHRRFEH